VSLIPNHNPTLELGSDAYAPYLINNLKHLKMSVVTERKRNTVVKDQPVSKETPKESEFLGTIIANMSIKAFKAEVNVTKIEVKENPDPTKNSLMYGDNMKVLGPCGNSYNDSLAEDDLQIVVLETDGVETYILCKKGNGGISGWKTTNSF